MGITLNNSSDYTPNYSTSNSKYATTPSMFVSKLLTNINSLNYYRSYSNDTSSIYVVTPSVSDMTGNTSYNELINQYIVNTASPYENFEYQSMTTTELNQQTQGYDDYDVTTYLHKVDITYKHKQISYEVTNNVVVTTTTPGKILTNNAKIIYQRKVCGGGTTTTTTTTQTVTVHDEYEGPETIIVRFLFTTVEKIEKEKPIPVNPTTYGAFPSGIGADYSVLISKIDPNYVAEQDINTLNTIANDYAQKIDENAVESQYFGSDNGVPYIYIIKESVDNAGEIQEDWSNLYSNTSYALENQVDNITININGVEQQKDCYKVYVAGKCQLIGVDNSNLLNDMASPQGSTEMKEYNLPHGYYHIVGKSIYLFLLTDINQATWPYSSNNNQVYLEDGSTLGTGVVNLSSRTIYNNNSYYLYKGSKTTNISSITPTSTIINEISNLRKLTMSDNLISIGHFGGQANPDNGFVFSKNLEYIGPLTLTYTAGTKAWVYNSNIKKIADNAFYDGVSSSPNLTLYLCEDPYAAEENSLVQRGYIEISSATTYIGASAFEGLSCNIVNLSKADLDYVGDKAFALANSCKTLYIRQILLSQRSWVVYEDYDGPPFGGVYGPSPDLVYVPNEAYDAIITNLEDSLTGINSCTYDTNSTHRTFGDALGGYSIYIRYNYSI